MINEIDMSKYRKPEYGVDEIFLKRWSPRAMSREEISQDELMSLFEAAKWAPSSYNN
jgi:nitroreductase